MKNGIDVTDNGHTHDKSLLIPIEDSRLVDMKYFPNAPASKRRVFCHLYLFSLFKSQLAAFQAVSFFWEQWGNTFSKWIIKTL